MEAHSTLAWPSPHRITRRLLAASHTRAPHHLLRGTFRAGQDIRARSIAVLVASAARQRPCVSSPMRFLYGQHAIFEAVALTQPTDRHAFRDRGSRHLRPTQTHGQRAHPHTCTY